MHAKCCGVSPCRRQRPEQLDRPPVHGQPPSPWSRTARFDRRRRGAAASLFSAPTDAGQAAMSSMSSLVGKEHYEGAGALNKYLCAHMTPTSKHMARLHECTLQDKHNIMLSASDEMNFLQMLIKMLGAKKTLDIGVYTGYSALAVALALPDDGKVIACDVTDKWVNQCGRGVWRDAGVEGKIDLRIAPALDTLQALIDAGEAGTFDFAFIDADKENYLPYYEACLRLLRVGGLIAVDNALWGARVLQDVAKMDPSTRAIHNLNVKVAGDARVHSSLLNIGDGLMLCRRLV